MTPSSTVSVLRPHCTTSHTALCTISPLVHFVNTSPSTLPHSIGFDYVHILPLQISKHHSREAGQVATPPPTILPVSLLPAIRLRLLTPVRKVPVGEVDLWTCSPAYAAAGVRFLSSSASAPVWNRMHERGGWIPRYLLQDPTRHLCRRILVIVFLSGPSTCIGIRPRRILIRKYTKIAPNAVHTAEWLDGLVRYTVC